MTTSAITSAFIFLVLHVMFVYHCSVLPFQNIGACFFHMVCTLRAVFDLTLTNWKPFSGPFCFETNVTHWNCCIWRQNVTCNAMGKYSKHRLMIQYCWFFPLCNITVNFLQPNQNEVVGLSFYMIKQHQMSMAQNPQNNIFGPGALDILLATGAWWRRAKLPRWHHPQMQIYTHMKEIGTKWHDGWAEVTRDLTASGPSNGEARLGKSWELRDTLCLNGVESNHSAHVPDSLIGL